MARIPSPVPHALHPDVFIMDQPGRTVLRLRHRRSSPTLRPPQRPRTRSRHPHMGESVEQEPEAIHLDQNCGTDPRQPQKTSTTNYQRRTLGAWVSSRLLKRRPISWFVGVGLRKLGMADFDGLFDPDVLEQVAPAAAGVEAGAGVNKRFRAVRAERGDVGAAIVG